MGSIVGQGSGVSYMTDSPMKGHTWVVLYVGQGSGVSYMTWAAVTDRCITGHTWVVLYDRKVVCLT